MPSQSPDQIPIPNWELQELDSLAQSGQLYGVDPNVLAVIAQAESGGEEAGAGVNSSGYGGYFGLGTSEYPGNHQVSYQTLETNSLPSFEAQAVTAAAEFASLENSHGGSVVDAENAYQGGSTEGSSLMSQELLPSELGASSNTAVPANGTASGTLDSLSGTPTTSGGSGGSSGVTIATIPILGNITIPTGLITRAALGIVGIILLIIALKELFSSNDVPTMASNAGQTVQQAGQNQAKSFTKDTAKPVAERGIEAGAVAAA